MVPLRYVAVEGLGGGGAEDEAVGEKPPHVRATCGAPSENAKPGMPT